MGICVSKKSLSLTSSTFNNTPEFSLNGKTFTAKVIDIYDGDTITVAIVVFDSIYKFNIRLSDIDTCEMKSSSPINKELALKARARLFQLITNKKLNLDAKRENIRKVLNESNYLIFIHCHEFDKYGRLLAHLYKQKSSDVRESYNHILVREKLAYMYQGKTKLTEEEQVQLLH